MTWGTSQNKETVQAYMEAYARWDHAAILATLTDDVVWFIPGALRLANAPHVAVIGGAEIYARFLPLADRIELTEVHLDAAGDVSIERPDPAAWIETGREDHEPRDGRPPYSFVTYRKRR